MIAIGMVAGNLDRALSEFLRDSWHTMPLIGSYHARRPRRNHTSAFKAKVAPAAVKSDQKLGQLAERFDVHSNRITAWKAQLEAVLWMCSVPALATAPRRVRST